MMVRNILAPPAMAWVVVNDPIQSGVTLLGSGFGDDTPAEAAHAERWPTFEERCFDSLRAYDDWVPARP